jgi:hypothetical protein
MCPCSPGSLDWEVCVEKWGDTQPMLESTFMSPAITVAIPGKDCSIIVLFSLLCLLSCWSQTWPLILQPRAWSTLVSRLFAEWIKE